MKKSTINILTQIFAVTFLILTFVVFASVPLARITKGKVGTVIADGDSLYVSIPWGAFAFVLPVATSNGDMVTALTDDGLVIKRLDHGVLVSENSYGKTYPSQGSTIQGKVIAVLYCPSCKPEGSQPWQADQSRSVYDELCQGTIPEPNMTGGTFNGAWGAPGEITIKGNLGFSKAKVLIDGQLYDAVIQVQPPGLSLDKTTRTIIRNLPISGNGSVTVKVSPVD